MLALLKALPIGAQVGIALAILGAAGGGYVAWRSSIFNQGAAYERQQQQERDDEAVGKAGDARGAVRDCRERGGVWSQSRGVCDWR